MILTLGVSGMSDSGILTCLTGGDTCFGNDCRSGLVTCLTCVDTCLTCLTVDDTGCGNHCGDGLFTCFTCCGCCCHTHCMGLVMFGPLTPSLSIVLSVTHGDHIQLVVTVLTIVFVNDL